MLRRSDKNATDHDKVKKVKHVQSRPQQSSALDANVQIEKLLEAIQVHNTKVCY